MELFILLGAGFLGAVFLSSQSDSPGVSFLWRFLAGISGGGIAYLALRLGGIFPQTPDFASFILLFVVGGLSGAAAMLLYFVIRRFIK